VARVLFGSGLLGVYADCVAMWKLFFFVCGSARKLGDPVILLLAYSVGGMPWLVLMDCVVLFVFDGLCWLCFWWLFFVLGVSHFGTVCGMRMAEF